MKCSEVNCCYGLINFKRDMNEARVDLEAQELEQST
jgi:hypothetical protein